MGSGDQEHLGKEMNCQEVHSEVRLRLVSRTGRVHLLPRRKLPAHWSSHSRYRPGTGTLRPKGLGTLLDKETLCQLTSGPERGPVLSQLLHFDFHQFLHKICMLMSSSASQEGTILLFQKREGIVSGPHPIPCLQDKRVNSVLPQLDGLRQDENQFNAAFVLSQCRTPKPQQQRHSLRTFISLQNPTLFFSPCYQNFLKEI